MPTNKTAIQFRIGPQDDWRSIPPSQSAILLWFLHENRGNRLVWDDLYRALGSQEVDRTLHTLRHKYGISIPCDRQAKSSGTGTIGLFRLGEAVEVRMHLRGDPDTYPPKINQDIHHPPHKSMGEPAMFPRVPVPKEDRPRTLNEGRSGGHD